MKFGTRWPPVPAGILIGISMLLAFVVAGRGIGASGAMTRFVAWVQHGLFPTATEQSAYFGKYFADGAHPLNDYVVFMMVGLLIGSFVASWLAGEFRFEVLRGPRSSVAYRLILALSGGVLGRLRGTPRQRLHQRPGPRRRGRVVGRFVGLPDVHFCRRLAGRLVRQKTMDLIAPFAKTGVITTAANLWLAIPIGFIFGFALFHAGFTDSRRIAWAFYFKDVGVPIVMFSAIATGMLGLWGLSLIGFLDISLVYMLPTYLLPMAVGGVLFGVGMAVGRLLPRYGRCFDCHRKNRCNDIHCWLSDWQSGIRAIFSRSGETFTTAVTKASIAWTSGSVSDLGLWF